MKIVLFLLITAAAALSAPKPDTTVIPDSTFARLLCQGLQVHQGKDAIADSAFQTGYQRAIDSIMIRQAKEAVLKETSTEYLRKIAIDQWAEHFHNSLK